MKADPRLTASARDAAIVITVSLAAAFVCATLNVSEHLRRWTDPLERYQLDELPFVLCVLMLGLVWFAVRRHRESRQELGRRQTTEHLLRAALADNRRLAQQNIQLQESERKALARELHDELGQYLNVIKLDAVELRDEPLPAVSIRERAAAIVDNSNHIHGSLTGLIRQLRPVGLDELGLAAALEHCIDGWRSRLAKAHLTLSLSGDLTALDETLCLTVYRLVQEALTNVAKHARATRVEVRVQLGALDGSGCEAVLISISDDGAGTDLAAPTVGLGLIGMRERVAAFAGTLRLESASARGFQLQAILPVPTSSEVSAWQQP